MLFIEYPSCSTCKKAKKFLVDHGIEFNARHIVEDTPTKDELYTWWKESNLELKKFFNTSGKLYKEMQLKDRLKEMSDEEKLALLSEHGMLIKRPILISDNDIFVGFQEDNYKKLCSEK